LGLVLVGILTGFYWTFVGLMILIAAIWAALSLNWIAFDVREQTYARRDSVVGHMKGSFQELEALFVLAETGLSVGRTVSLGRSVIYRLVLQWHGMSLPSIILEQDYRSLSLGAPLGSAAGHTLQTAERYAKSLGVPLVNHTHVSVSNPV